MADAEETEIRTKVEALAKARYGDTSPASLKRLFLSYDADRDGLANKDEIEALFADADVGSWATRGLYASGTIDAMDKNGDGKVSWEEYAVRAGIPLEDPLKPKGSGPTTPTTPGYPTYDQWKAAQSGSPVVAPSGPGSPGSFLEVAKAGPTDTGFGYLPWVVGGGLLAWWLWRRRA